MSMTDNFQQARWSETRAAIHAMKRHAVLSFPAEEYFNCHATVQRLNDAYSGVRKWVMTVKDKASTITRVK
jgi:hypothetical protein